MLSVRWLHVLGMALALGGAALTWGLLRHSEVEGEAAVGVATAYEWTFWAAAGLLVMTGVGNLGSLVPSVPAGDTGGFAPLLPAPDTYWGTALAVKLLAVVALLVFSQVRTVLVYRFRRADADSGRYRQVLRASYALTALWLAGVVALAEVLAHG